jgi:hypothetical protein
MRLLNEMKADLLKLQGINCKSAIGLEHKVEALWDLENQAASAYQAQLASNEATRAAGRVPLAPEYAERLVELYGAVADAWLAARKEQPSDVLAVEKLIVLWNAPRVCQRCRQADAPYMLVENDEKGADVDETNCCIHCLAPEEIALLKHDTAFSEQSFEVHCQAKLAVWHNAHFAPTSPAEITSESLAQEQERVFGSCGGKCGEAPCIAWNASHKRLMARWAQHVAENPETPDLDPEVEDYLNNHGLGSFSIDGGGLSRADLTLSIGHHGARFRVDGDGDMVCDPGQNFVRFSDATEFLEALAKFMGYALSPRVNVHEPIDPAMWYVLDSDNVRLSKHLTQSDAMQRADILYSSMYVVSGASMLASARSEEACPF